jgi:hypothetical protein
MSSRIGIACFWSVCLLSPQSAKPTGKKFQAGKATAKSFGGGWRVGDKVELEADFDIDSLDDAAAWLDYDTDSNAVLVIQSACGDSFLCDVVPACRNPR